MRPAKLGLIFGQIRTNFRTNCRKSVICPRTLSDNYCFVRRLRAFVKSSPHKMNLGEANGLMSSAFRSSVTLLSNTYPNGSKSMTRLHASALLEADSMACRKFFSMTSDVKRVVQKNEVSTGVISSASLVVFSLAALDLTERTNSARLDADMLMLL